MNRSIAGVGLGLRWPLLEDLLEHPSAELAWLEIAPENYMRRGGRFPATLETCLERWPVVTHGLSLSLGGTEAPDRSYLHTLRDFLQRVQTPWHSDHLCFSIASGTAAHDLLPLPFSKAMVTQVVDRIRSAQDALGVPIAVENISAYVIVPGSEMTESEFVTEVVQRAECQLLLDVNNVFVNAQNHGFDAKTALAAMPLDRVVQLHMAGHERTPEGCIDTHAEDICDDVFALLAWTLQRTGPVPILLERDDNFPSWEHLGREIAKLHACWSDATRAASVENASALRSSF